MAGFKVAPNCPSSGAAAAAFPGFPGPCCSAARSMMTSRFDSNFASSACAADESSSQSGLAHPRLDLLMHSSNSILIFHSPGFPTSLPTKAQLVFASSFRAQNCVPFSTSSKRFLDLRLTRSASRSRPRTAFYDPARRVLRAKPVARSGLETTCLFSDLHSPSGFLNPSGS